MNQEKATQENTSHKGGEKPAPPVVPDGLTAAEFEALKQERGEKLVLLEGPTLDGETMAVACLNPFGDIHLHQSYQQEVNSLRLFDARKMLVENCVLTGKETVLGDNAMFRATASALARLFPRPSHRVYLGDRLPDGMKAAAFKAARDAWGDQVARLEVPVDGEGNKAIVAVRSPASDIELCSKTEALIANENQYLATTGLVKECLLSRPDLKANHYAFVSVSDWLLAQIPQGVATLKKF